MSARTDLLLLYDQWRRLSEAEAGAIQTATWPRVQECLEAKFLLQARILALKEVLNAEPAPEESGGGEAEPALRRVLQELIALEMRNSELLAEQRRQTEAKSLEMQQVARNLRQMHRAYAAAPPAHWDSYS